MPNFHNDKTPIVGGVFQERGLEESLQALGEILAALAMLVYRYFEYDDLLKMLYQHIKEASGGQNQAT